MRIRRVVLTALTVAIFVPSLAVGDNEIPLTRRFGIGTRAMGMGGAGVALVDDGSSLFLNPAGLTRVRRIEIQGELKHQSFGLDTEYRGTLSEGTSIATKLGSLTGVYPFPTYRGSLVIAGGISHLFTTDEEFIFSDFETGEDLLERFSYTVTGGVSAWGVGGAVDISPNASLGITFLLWDGHDDLINNYDCRFCGSPDTISYERLIGTDYSGLSAVIGLQFRLSPWLGIGASIETPNSLTLEGTEVFRRIEGPEEYAYLFRDKLKLPFSYVVGGALNFGGVLLACDVRHTDWRQINYEGVMRDEGEFQYQATTEFHLGAEYLLPFYPVRVRAGYYTEPLAYRAVEINNDRDFYTIGGGLLIDDVLALDFAMIFGRLKWLQEFQDRDILRDESFSRALFSASYRF